MGKKYEVEEKPICNAVCTYRTRGDYLQRLELFEKSIQAYSEALKWNIDDVRSLLGRSLARAKATHYAGALADAARASELEPENLTAMQMRAQTEYFKCDFERALVLAHRGQRLRKFPPKFAECARQAEETVRECAGRCAKKVLTSAIPLVHLVDLKRESIDTEAPQVAVRRSRLQKQPKHEVQVISRVEKQRSEQISRMMACKYLERMAHDKYFLKALCKDERLASANKQGSQKLKELANNALADVEKRQAVLRARRPLYAARDSEAAARLRLTGARKQQRSRAQQQHETDARRLIDAAAALQEQREMARCVEQAEFAMERLSRKPPSMLPNKEKFLQELYDIVANAFLDQKRVAQRMSESDREKRAYVLLGMIVSRDPSMDSVLRARPPPPRDPGGRKRELERALTMSTRSIERCYLMHELARLHIDTKDGNRARFYASKCQLEARSSNQKAWLLNSTFLLARCHLILQNRPEARAVLLEGSGLARSFRYIDVAEFFDTCVNVSVEGDITVLEDEVEKREKEMVSLMQDADMKSAAQHLFRKMSVIPVSRRFSVMPGSRLDDSQPQTPFSRRISIMPKAPQPVRLTQKSKQPLGLQEFDV